MKKLMKSIVASAFAFSALSMSAQASTYPDKEITLVVNFGAGGVTDIATRLFVKYFETEMGVPIVVVNKPGASATLGPAFLARQKPDGYTIGVVTYSTVAITPNLLEVPYKIKDFDFIGVYGRYRYGLVVGADSPYQSVDDLINAAKQSKDPIFFAAPSAPNNLVFFELANKTGAKFEQVLYKSGTESVTAAASGAVAAAVQTPPEINPQVNGGKVRMLASVSPNRWSDRPEIPTLKELGYDVSIESWMSLASPLGTPANIQKRLSDALEAVVKNPLYQQELGKIGLDPIYMTGTQYQQKALEGYKQMREQLGAIGQKLAPEIQQ